MQHPTLPDRQGPPPDQPPATSPRRRTPIAILAVIAVLAVAGVLVYTFVVTGGSAPALRNPGAAPGSPVNVATSSPAPSGVKSGILAMTRYSNKTTYAFVDPDSGKYAEAVTFTIPANRTMLASSSATVAASPDLTKFAVTSTDNGKSAAGWLDSSGKFTAVTATTDPGPFGGNPPSYEAVGFDSAGNFYYKQNSQGAMHTEVYRVPAGSTSNAQKLTLTPPGAASYGAVLNSDGSLLFGCSNWTGNWLDANTVVSAIAPGTQIAKIAVAGRDSGGCPNLPASNEVPLLPTTNTVNVHDPVANPDGTKVAFFYADPDPKRNFPNVYIVGTDGKSQPTRVNLSESDAKKLTGANLLRWS